MDSASVPCPAAVYSPPHRRQNARRQQSGQQQQVWKLWMSIRRRWSTLERHQVQWLIHGHTHRPAVHPLEANGKPAFRVVLGAWHSEGSMVKVSKDDVELISFPF
jgi:UDP-2,3-diacylglucosamine pyrophosphatase LpxH